MGFLNDSDQLDQLEEKNEILNQELSMEEKKALIAKAKERHGGDWKRFLSDAHSGIDWEAVKFKMGE